MNDAPPPFNDDRDGPPMPTLHELMAMMDESDRASAGGDVVSVSEVLSDLDSAIARMSAKRGQTAA